MVEEFDLCRPNDVDEFDCCRSNAAAASGNLAANTGCVKGEWLRVRAGVSGDTLLSVDAVDAAFDTDSSASAAAFGNFDANTGFVSGELLRVKVMGAFTCTIVMVARKRTTESAVRSAD
jgi:hypothetical protein